MLARGLINTPEQQDVLTDIITMRHVGMYVWNR